MNIEDVRQQILEGLGTIVPDGWEVTADTTYDVHSGLIQIGHASEILTDAFDGYAFDLPITGWISEVDDTTRVRALYQLVSKDEGSILRYVQDATVFADIGIQAVAVEPREKGQSDYLVAEVVVRLSYHDDDVVPRSY